MKISVLTSFPELFPGALSSGLTGKALEKGLWNLDVINIRDFAEDKHKAIDDTPYGGGAGMVMRADILAKAIEFGEKQQKSDKIIYLSPRGRVFNQQIADEISQLEKVTLISARYEGVDQRVIDKYNVEEVSIGDYILTNGDIAAHVLIDACVRKINSVLGNPKTHFEESFSIFGSNFLLEYPQYTRPESCFGVSVPEVLKSGNHALIEKWRFEQAKLVTQKNRPDLWEKFSS
jgi:tRNA (guanine37-N1)-methyltransferase